MAESRTQSPRPPFLPRAELGPRPAVGRTGLGRGLLGPESGIHLLQPNTVFPGRSRRHWACPSLQPPSHHLLPVYLFILKSHLPTLLGHQTYWPPHGEGNEGERGTVSPHGQGKPRSASPSALPALQAPAGRLGSNPSCGASWLCDCSVPPSPHL